MEEGGFSTSAAKKKKIGHAEGSSSLKAGLGAEGSVLTFMQPGQPKTQSLHGDTSSLHNAGPADKDDPLY